MATLLANSVSRNVYAASPFRIIQGQFTLVAGAAATVNVPVAGITPGSVVLVSGAGAGINNPVSVFVPLAGGSFNIITSAVILANTTYNYVAFLDA